VKALRAFSISRCLVVALMLLSWLVVTNHCALGLMQAALSAKAEHAHCHASTSDNGQKAPADGMRECCRVIKASVTDTPEFKFDAAKLQIQAFVILSALVAPVESSAPAFIHDHGPPRVISFAEGILQRSLLSHAPPTLA
jgi:hypothetical protein